MIHRVFKYNSWLFVKQSVCLFVDSLQILPLYNVQHCKKEMLKLSHKGKTIDEKWLYMTRLVIISLYFEAGVVNRNQNSTILLIFE
jgi:hypothetical protein